MHDLELCSLQLVESGLFLLFFLFLFLFLFLYFLLVLCIPCMCLPYVWVPIDFKRHSVEELGLRAETPVGTSFIDAHAGGVGVMESIAVLDSETKEYDKDAKV